MAARKNKLRIRKGELSINADIRVKKLKPENLGESPEIVRREKSTGQVVVRVSYDKDSGAVLEDGYGFKYVNEDGKEVPKENIVYYRVNPDGEEERVKKFEPTIGKSRKLKPLKWMGMGDVNELLISKTYEIYGEEQTDEAELLELVRYIQDQGMAPVVPVVFRKSFKKKWGVILPWVEDDEFSVLMKLAKAKIDPRNEMALTVEEMKEEANVETLEEEVPF